MRAVDELVKDGSVTYFLEEIIVLPLLHSPDWAIDILKIQSACMHFEKVSATWNEMKNLEKIIKH